MNFKPRPLRIFAYEYITGGGLIHEALPPSLAREGEMMLRALITDLLDIPGVEVVATRDPRLPALDLPVVVFTPRDALHAKNIFSHCVGETDATWLIAPESGKTLERLSREVLAQRCALVGSSPEAVAISASKSETVRVLSTRGIKMIPTYAASDAVAETSGLWVAKPNDGQGCLDTRLFDNFALAVAWAYTRDVGNFVIQPFVSGEAYSLSMLCRDGDAILLTGNRQNVMIRDGQFYYLGGEVNALDITQDPYPQLARDIATALPGLWGYVGVDFIASETGPVVLEVNPRLTTSYVGLRAALNMNPALLVLNLFDASAPLPVIKAKPNRIMVEVDGCDVA